MRLGYSAIFWKKTKPICSMYGIFTYIWLIIRATGWYIFHTWSTWEATLKDIGGWTWTNVRIQKVTTTPLFPANQPAGYVCEGDLIYMALLVFCSSLGLVVKYRYIYIIIYASNSTTVFFWKHLCTNLWQELEMNITNFIVWPLEKERRLCNDGRLWFQNIFWDHVLFDCTIAQLALLR